MFWSKVEGYVCQFAMIRLYRFQRFLRGQYREGPGNVSAHEFVCLKIENHTYMLVTNLWKGPEREVDYAPKKVEYCIISAQKAANSFDWFPFVLVSIGGFHIKVLLIHITSQINERVNYHSIKSYW
jgi:hypothetical protein